LPPPIGHTVFYRTVPLTYFMAGLEPDS